jgi:hypothetical protein
MPTYPGAPVNKLSLAGPAVVVRAAPAVAAAVASPVSAAQAPATAGATGGTSSVSRQVADTLFTALGSAAAAPAASAVAAGGGQEAVSAAAAAAMSTAAPSQTDLDRLVWGNAGETEWWDFTRRCRHVSHLLSLPLLEMPQ